MKLIDNNTDLLSPKIINQAAIDGDDYALFIIERVGFYVGSALSSVSNLLDIDTFIVGGGVSAFGQPLLSSIKRTLEEKVLKALKNRIKVFPALLKNEAGIVGSSSLAFYNL
ncbi:MAG: ROK family protein [Bacteroidetes bacterium]|nr:ROK family protein [Bacteroidota bacterium]